MRTCMEGCQPLRPAELRNGAVPAAQFALLSGYALYVEGLAENFVAAATAVRVLTSRFGHARARQRRSAFRCGGVLRLCLPCSRVSAPSIRAAGSQFPEDHVYGGARAVLLDSHEMSAHAWTCRRAAR